MQAPGDAGVARSTILSELWHAVVARSRPELWHAVMAHSISACRNAMACRNGSLVPRPSTLSAHYTRAHADSYARGRPGLKHHVR